jgi:hypothetical protein
MREKNEEEKSAKKCYGVGGTPVVTRLSYGASTQRYKIGIIRQILYSIDMTHPR